jgi:hypothetical protein
LSKPEKSSNTVEAALVEKASNFLTSALFHHLMSLGTHADIQE